MGRDSHMRRESHRRNRIETFFQRMPDGVALLDVSNEWEIVDVNHAFESMFGYDRSTLIGALLTDMLVPPDRDPIDPTAKGAQTTLVEETVRLSADGPRTFRYRGFVTTVDGEPYEYAIYTDVSDRPPHGRPLDRRDEKLESLVKTIAHDLRNPLALGTGHLECIRRWIHSTTDEFDVETNGSSVTSTSVDDENESPIGGAFPNSTESRTDGITPDSTESPLVEKTVGASESMGGQTTDEITEIDDPTSIRTHVNELSLALKRMDDMIEEVLENARSGSQSSTVEPVDLGAVIERARRTTDPTLDVIVEGPLPPVDGDEGRLLSLFENVFVNARTHVGSNVTITISGTEEGFSITDDGPGIPSDARHRIFDSGYTTHPDGHGFGLAIVADIVEAHGWEIAVDDSDEGGLRFDIRTDTQPTIDRS